MMPDAVLVLQWWFVFFAIGLAFLPFTTMVFDQFVDRGYIFSKVIGIAIITYIVFILNVTRLLKFTLPTIFFALAVCLLANVVLMKVKKVNLKNINLKMV